jgi:hypothetical protein
MPEETLQPCAYHVVRYQPNLIRDEWVNIGVLLLDPATGRVRQRWLEEPADLVRLRRLHPAADEELLLRLPAEFDRQFAGREMQAEAILENFDETLSNAVQLAPRKGLLARDPDAELDRLFREQVEPLREPRRGAQEIRTRSDVRARAADFFRTEKILRLMQRGTRGFVHSVALGRDPGQAKLLAYTAGAIRERVKHSEFLAVTEREPARGNVRDQFVSGILAESDIRVVPLAALRKWAHDVAPVLRAEGA